MDVKDLRRSEIALRAAMLNVDIGEVQLTISCLTKKNQAWKVSGYHVPRGMHFFQAKFIDSLHGGVHGRRSMPDDNDQSRSRSGTMKEWIVFCKLRHNSRGSRALSNSLVGLNIVIAFEVSCMHVMRRGQS